MTGVHQLRLLTKKSSKTSLQLNSIITDAFPVSDVSMGEHNSRARIAELIHRLLGKIVFNI